MKEIAAYFPKVIALAPDRQSRSGIRLMGVDEEETTGGAASFGAQRMSSFTTYTE